MKNDKNIVKNRFFLFICNEFIVFMEKHTVSVVMCTYNGAKFLREQLDSILSQTYPIYELIVRDDGSQDGTMDILLEYAARHACIKVFQNVRNLGCNQNFHDALYQATGDYIAISDQDDIWFPQKIEKGVETIGTGNYDMCFSDVIATTSYTDKQVENYTALPFTAEALLFRNTIPGHAMLIKRSFIASLPEWDNMVFFYDWWLAVNAAVKDSIVKYDRPLAWHRLHEKSVTLMAGQAMAKKKNRSPIAPYILGVRYFFKVRRRKSWRCFYENIYRNTSESHHPVLHTVTRLLFSKNPLQLVRLCWVCMKHRREIYPVPHKGKRLIFMIRGFFTPFICSYYNANFHEE